MEKVAGSGQSGFKRKRGHKLKGKSSRINYWKKSKTLNISGLSKENKHLLHIGLPVIF